MKNKEVQIGVQYLANVSGKVVSVQITHKLSLANGWRARNCVTGRSITIRSGKRLRNIVTK